jgi:hypothetical protein
MKIQNLEKNSKEIKNIQYVLNDRESQMMLFMNTKFNRKDQKSTPYIGR